MRKNIFLLLTILSLVLVSQFALSIPIGTIIWKCDVGPSRTSPAISKSGTIYVGDLEGYMCAVSQNGTLKWKYKTEGAIYDSPTVGKNGTIYFMSNEGFLYALNRNGSLKWRRRINYGIISNLVFSVVIGKDNVLYIGNDHFLYSLDKNGNLIWKKELSDHISTSPSIGENGTIYIGTKRGKLYAISPNGKTEWQFSTGSAITSDISIDKNKVIYFGDTDGYLYVINKNGILRWKFYVGKAIYIPVSTGKNYIGDVVYLACDNTIYSIENDGIIVWTYKTKDRFPISSVVVGKDTYGFEHIYFADGNTIYSLSPYGRKNWDLSLETKIFSFPAMLKSGALCVTSMGGYLYAIKTASNGLAISSWPKFHGGYENNDFYLNGVK